VWIEYGLQSAHERTLNFINRGHTCHDFVKAANMTSERGIKVGVHLILGLPGETRDDMLKTADKISRLPVSGIKFHVLHVLKDTKLAEYYRNGEIRLLTMDEYISILCDFLERVDPGCVVFRLVSDAKEDCLIGPKWINDKSAVLSSVMKELNNRGSYQGNVFKGREKRCGKGTGQVRQEL
ncbi:MAG: TIGR01212 family radical SAM protein, partial [Candidatus Omnitrophica bacterium]|nr:TIGR01212 family radical SAM protein [Candidatus Omnitrophota bacterium]